MLLKTSYDPDAKIGSRFGICSRAVCLESPETIIPAIKAVSKVF